MTGYSIYGKLIAAAGRQAELESILLRAAEEMAQLEECYIYLVGRNQDEPEAVYIFEVWRDKAAHQAALGLPVFQTMIAQARPMIEDMADYPSLEIVGGKA